MNSLKEMPDAQMRCAIAALDSLIDGEAAVDILIANGTRSIPYLDEYLVKGRPRTIALPRCRAVHALGQLGAQATLISYFREYRIPDDAQVRFAEDAVRSVAADELLRWKSSEVFGVLLDAAKQRATSGLIFALGEFRRAESVPFLFEMLSDDFCGNEATAALRKLPEDAHQFAILTLRNRTSVRLEEPSGRLRLRAILQLLRDVGFRPEEWQDVCLYLASDDADVVIATAALGVENGPSEDRQHMVNALYRISRHVNWLQEAQIDALLDSCHDDAYKLAQMDAVRRLAEGERPAWLDPSWRILKHVLGKDMPEFHDARSASLNRAMK
jgi:hypothetical protein